MGEDGEDKLTAVARHIARTLGRSETAADDIVQILTDFDSRFSRENLFGAGRFPSAEDGSGGGGGDSRIGAGSSYSDADRTFRVVDRQISRFVAMDRLIWCDSADASSFLESVDDLLSAMRELDSPLLDRAEDLLQQSMLRLEEEFGALMRQADGGGDPAATILFDSGEEDDDDECSDGDDQIPVAQPVQDYNIVVDAIPPGTVADLHEIARRMMAAGFGRECAHSFASSRRDFLDESVARLGIRQRSSSEETPWAALQVEIPRWTRAVEMSFRILFPSERRLCDRIFAGLRPAADLAFAEACRGTAIQLLGFADAVAVGSRAPERLFRVIDMYETLGGVLPELAAVFTDQYSAILRSEAGSVWRGLGAAIRGIFMELENLIRRDPAKAPVPGGGIHPITRYVMNYLRAASASRRSLEIATEEDGAAAAVAPDIDLERPYSSLSVQIAWIMEVLQVNLEKKSKIYKDPGLSFVFLMNNGRYIVQKAREGELGVLLGDEWVRRETARVRRWHGEYLRASWGKVVAALRVGGEEELAAAVMRERARVFESCIDEICREQRRWVVADEQLREDLRAAVSAMVVPAYRSFLGRLRTAEGGGKRVGKGGVKYRPVEEVETFIAKLFEGSTRMP